jgi:hypothetical protein
LQPGLCQLLVSQSAHLPPLQPLLDARASNSSMSDTQQASSVPLPTPPRWSSWSPQFTRSPRSARTLRAALRIPLKLRRRSSMSLPRLPSACCHRLHQGTHMGLLLLQTLRLQLLAQVIPPVRPTCLSALSPRLMGLISPLPLGTASLFPSQPLPRTLLLLGTLLQRKL